MSLKNIPSGEQTPEDIYVIIEIPNNTHSIKYEINKQTQVLFVDRLIPTPMIYPFNYGYINKTLSDDGDPLDVIIPIPYKLQPRCVMHCKPIGIFKMIDESGLDNKIIALPHEKISRDYKKQNNIHDISTVLKNKIIHFFQHYKDLEIKKWVKIVGFEDVISAKKEIQQSVNQYFQNQIS